MDYLNLPICVACGTQYAEKDKKNCAICEDPRQFVPPSGQSFTNLSKLRESHKNVKQQDEADERIWSIWTEPKFAIGQRAVFLETPHGNVLWDCIAFLDQETIDWINERGGLVAIVISHPHFYTTLAYWSSQFDCPVYTSLEDRTDGWLALPAQKGGMQRFVAGNHLIADVKDPSGRPAMDDVVGRWLNIVPGMMAVQCGGHFRGSLVLHWDGISSKDGPKGGDGGGKLLISDTMMMVPAAKTPLENRMYDDAGVGASATNTTTTFAFQYAIPNMIPLDPPSVSKIWKALKAAKVLDGVTSVFGNIPGLDLKIQNDEKDNLRKRVLLSMQVHLQAMGWNNHELLNEKP